MQDVLLSLIRLDLLLESIAGFIALAVSHYANKAFRLTGQKKLSDLATGFLVLSAAMFGHVIGTWYFFVLKGGDIGSLEGSTVFSVVTIAYGTMKIMAYILFALSTRPIGGGHSPALGLFMALPILIDPRLDVVAIIILVVVVLQSAMNYLAVRSHYALYVLVGFCLLLLSHMSAAYAERGYILSQVFQFLGFIALLVMLVRAGREV